MARINRDDVDKLYDYDLYIPSRTIYMGSVSSDESGESGVEAIMAERVIKALHLLDQKDEPITIIMNNPGGDWYHGMAIYDAIKACKSHITIKVMGMAMSMGGIILQAADERIMAPNSRFMMHYGYMGMDSTHSKTFDKWADENKRINSEMELLLLEKIQEVKPSFTLKGLQDLLNYDTIYTAQEAVDMGLADKVL
jgi:ATP-dependent Clp endopeptidase proteolytic subunit ClpP